MASKGEKKTTKTAKATGKKSGDEKKTAKANGKKKGDDKTKKTAGSKGVKK